MKIWIHIDGVQQGPYEADSLPLDKISDDTPVWYEGLANWTRAADAPAVACLLHGDERPADEPVSYHEHMRRMHSQGSESSDGSETSEISEDSEATECPQSYIVWSVLLTLVCCNPIGIIPIITGSSVRSRWRNRQYDSARRQSETTAWWLMITIVTSLMLAPLAMLMQSL